MTDLVSVLSSYHPAPPEWLWRIDDMRVMLEGDDRLAPRPIPSTSPPTPGSDIFRSINEDALGRLDEWIPSLGLKRARRKPGGWHAVAEWRPSGTGRALGKRSLNLSFTPQGIVDFGDGPRNYTALDVVIAAMSLDINAAYDWLARILGYVEQAPEPIIDSKTARAEKASASPKPAPPSTGFISARDLVRKEFEPIRWIVPDLLPEGLTILASKSKVGKSWLALLLGLSVGGGDTFFGRTCEAGDALYLALEDSERRVKDRLQKMIPLYRQDGAKRVPDRLIIKTEWSRVDQGGLKNLETWLDTVSNPRLVIIDVWRRVAPPHKAGVNAYNQDYEHLGPLQQLALKRRIALILVMHLKKAPGDGGDPFDEVLGSTGQVGTADTTLILKRTGEGASLYGRGRDVEEFELAVKFDPENGHWESLGDAEQVRHAKESNVIIRELRETGRPMTVAQIVEATGLPRERVDVDLGRLVKAGKIVKVTRGVYAACHE